VVDLVRRRLLRGSAAGAALAALGSPGAALAELLPPSRLLPAKLTDIDHVIVLMKENRSFDHYFGTLAGVRGFDDVEVLTLANGRPVFHQPDAMHADGYVLPFRLDTTRTSAQRMRALSHHWSVLHSSWNGGKMDNWIAAHRAPNKESAPLTMGYLTRQDLPFYYALADAFTICDGYHASVMGPTHPNRYFLMTGSIDALGKNGGPAINNKGNSYSWETYPERLERAGITWRIYHDWDGSGLNMPRNFTQFQAASEKSALFEHAMRERSFHQLLSDLRSGNIPQVTWILPPALQTSIRQHAGGGRTSHAPHPGSAVGQSQTVGEDGAHSQLRRERRSLRSCGPPTPPPGRRESSFTACRSASASACHASSSRRSAAAATRAATPSITRRCCA
jgi:phospholipase C